MNDETYEIVCWPEIQSLLGIDGFKDNAYLINDDKGMNDFGNSAYFVNSGWLKSHK